MTVVIEGAAKAWARRLYGCALAVQAALGGGRRGGGCRVWYGGARTAKLGGPALKLAKLAGRFPDHGWGFSLVYLLSNMPYLPQAALAALRKRRVPVVLNQNGVFYPAWYGGDWRGRNEEMARAYHAADHVLWQSEFCRRAAERFLGQRRGPGEILPNAVDVDRFAPAALRTERPFRFLLTGRIDAHQGYRLERAAQGLAEARRQGLDAELLAAGVFDPALAAKLAGQPGVILRGPYTPGEAPALYREADAYVTLTHQDACPTGVIEALASGLPVVHADTGGVPELVGPAGVAVATGEDWEEQRVPDVARVAQAMIQVAEGHGELAALARRRAVERFSLERWLGRHDELFSSLLDRR